ncbi:unnamed protein product [Closterium sp. NIES-64]|nr:unnamed protein product [Closterium sp. NIES-64]
MVDCDAHKELCSKFGVSGYPTLKWFPRNSLTPETYTGDREAEKLLEFANQKSGSRAALPAGKPSLVVEVTPDNFTEIVKDKTKHVLLEFYAPWCGMCKSLAPDYEALAEAFQYEPDIVIAKFDADKYKGTVEKYKIKRYKIKGYPELRWYPKEDKRVDLIGLFTPCFCVGLLVPIPARYKIKGYPELRWYPKNNKRGEPYQTSRNLQPLIDFVNAKANTLRKKGGLLDDDPLMDLVNAKANTLRKKGGLPDDDVGRIKDLVKTQDSSAVRPGIKGAEEGAMIHPLLSSVPLRSLLPGSLPGAACMQVGRIKDLDKIAVKYALASKEQRVQLRTQMSNTIDFLDAKKDPFAQIYMKIIDHIDSNERYLADEYARVERMLKTPLAPAKIDQFTVRKHILTAFLEFDEEEVAIS